MKGRKFGKIIFFVLVGFIIGSGLFLIGYIGYDSIWPRNIVEFYDQNGKPTTLLPLAREYMGNNKELIPTFHPGDIVPIRMRGYKYTNDIPQIITKLVDGYKKELEEVHDAKEIGPFDKVGLSRKIPMDAYGSYNKPCYIEITYVYDRNLIRRGETYKVRTEPFYIQVVPKEHDNDQDITLIKKIIREMKKTGELK